MVLRCVSLPGCLLLTTFRSPRKSVARNFSTVIVGFGLPGNLSPAIFQRSSGYSVYPAVFTSSTWRCPAPWEAKRRSSRAERVLSTDWQLTRRKSLNVQTSPSSSHAFVVCNHVLNACLVWEATLEVDAGNSKGAKHVLSSTRLD